MLNNPENATDHEAHGRIDQCLRQLSMGEDVEIFSEIYDYYAGRVLTLLHSRGIQSVDAEHYMQDIMLQVWRSARLYDANTVSSSTWIFGLARDYLLENVRGEPRVECDFASQSDTLCSGRPTNAV